MCDREKSVYKYRSSEEKKNRIFITPSWRCTDDPAEPFLKAPKGHRRYAARSTVSFFPPTMYISKRKKKKKDFLSSETIAWERERIILQPAAKNP